MFPGTLQIYLVKHTNIIAKFKDKYWRDIEKQMLTQILKTKKLGQNFKFKFWFQFLNINFNQIDLQFSGKYFCRYIKCQAIKRWVFALHM